MKNNIKKVDSDFHAVDYMYQIREELTEQFNADKSKYLKKLKDTVNEFKIRQLQFSKNSDAR
ncbi:MAG: hypothetical protein ABIP95_05730 [Pelobium sp.]